MEKISSPQITETINAGNELAIDLVNVSGNSFVSVETASHDIIHVQCEEQLPREKIDVLFRSAESGPCGGVRMTINLIPGIMDAYPDKRLVVNAPPTNGADSNAFFREQGIFMSVKPQELKEGDVYVISAHGNPRDLQEAEQNETISVFDTTCPFVKHTHDEIREVNRLVSKEAEQGKDISSGVIYLSIGGKPDHPERAGARNLAEDIGLPFMEVEGYEDLVSVLESAHAKGIKRIRIVSQTTNNAEEAIRMARNITEYTKQNYEDIDVDTFPFNERDICLTVTDRQNAVREMVSTLNVEELIVIGSIHSKNTKSLIDVALDEASQVLASSKELSLQRIIKVNSWLQLPKDISGRVGIVSGASTLDPNVEGVIKRLGWGPDEVALVGENVHTRRRANKVFMPIDRHKQTQKQLAEMLSKNDEKI